ncbi:MAG: nucleotidyltransferase family protein, partial [Sedimenticola sp.]
LKLDTEDDLILLCIHGSKEKWRKLKWVADIAWYLKRQPGLNMQSLIERTESQGLARMVRIGLGLSEQLLDEPLPDTARQWISNDPDAGNLISKITQTIFQHQIEEKSIYRLSRFHWDMRERIRDKWRYLYRTVTQPRTQHFQDITIPDSLFFLYTPYKVIHDYLLLPIWFRINNRRKTSIDIKSKREDSDETS